MITINIVGGLEDKLVELAHQNGETPEDTASQTIENAWFDTMREMDNYENENCNHDTLILVVTPNHSYYRCRWCGKRLDVFDDEDIPF